MHQHHKNGVQLFTWYSGKGTAESALSFIDKVVAADMAAEGVACETDKGMTCIHACDKSTVCQTVLAQHESLTAPKHVFGDMEERLPKEVIRQLDELEPPHDAGTPQKVEAYESMHRLLKEKGSNIYNAKMTAYCHKHRMVCQVWDLPNPKDPARPLIMAVVGPSCVDWTKRRTGKCLGLSGKTARAFWQFLTELEELMPDVIIYENVANFPPSIWDEFGHSKGSFYQHLTMVVSPDMLGWPIVRPRRFGALINASKNHFDGSTDEFLALFQCTVEVSGDIFFAAPDTDLLGKNFAFECVRVWCPTVVVCFPLCVVSFFIV